MLHGETIHSPLPQDIPWWSPDFAVFFGGALPRAVRDRHRRGLCDPALDLDTCRGGCGCHGEEHPAESH